MSFPKIFNPGDKVTFDLDPDGEILVVVSSKFHRTTVKTLDGIEISHATDLLSSVNLPTAI